MSGCVPKWELIHVGKLLEQESEKAKTQTTASARDTRAWYTRTRHHKIQTQTFKTHSSMAPEFVEYLQPFHVIARQPYHSKKD